MKAILFRIPTFPEKSETFIENQIVAVIQLGYDVQIVVNRKNDLTHSSQPELIKQYKLMDKCIELYNVQLSNRLLRFRLIMGGLLRGIDWRALNLFSFAKHGKTGLLGTHFINYVQVKKYLKSHLIHIQFGTAVSPFDKFKEAGLVKGKLITTFHGYDVHFDEQNKQSRINEYRLIFGLGDLFTSNTEYLANQVLEIGCPVDRLKVVHVPVDTKKFTAKTKANQDLIKLISVGRLIKWKGHEFGIRSVHELKKRGYGNLRYIIIGAGQELENLHSLVVELGLREEVSFAGAKSQEEIITCLQNSDVFLMTSVSDETGRRETQGVATIEAQACGLPVVAFNSGGVPYTLQDGVTGFLCEEGNYVAMASQIERLMADVKLRNSMSISARQFVEDVFSQQVILRQWEELYSA